MSVHMPAYRPASNRGRKGVGSPEGTDGLKSGGMIIGRMEVRNQQGRGGWLGGGGEEGREGGTKAARNDQSGLMSEKEMQEVLK